MAETSTPYAGVPLRDQDVRFPVPPEQALAAVRSQRPRLLATLTTLTEEQWAAPSRCAGWSVQDVVRHLTHMNTVQLEAIAAARAGERFGYFSTFDPKQTPIDQLAAAGPEPVAATLGQYADTTARLIEATAALAADGGDLLISTPVGRQSWDRAALHSLFDSAVHERDIARPLGRRVEAPAEETEAIAAYQVLLVARVLAVVGAELDVALHLAGGPDLRARIAGPVVSVEPGATAGAAVEARGEVDAVLDAIAGRGELAAALDGPPEVLLGMSALASLI